MQHVFIIGAKGIPARYGGYETFVENLTKHRVSSGIKYHVACAVDEEVRANNIEYNNAHCFCIKWKRVGAAKAVFYDLDALKYCISYIKENHIKHPIIYILACRIGPFISKYVDMIHSLGGVVFVNPDGHEWMRAKWSFLIRKYWKFSERLMVKNADLIVCDSRNIEAYIKSEYPEYFPDTTYIAYGADTSRSVLTDNDPSFVSWLKKNNLKINDYYLVVGRFVPENNYEIMIREFMKSNSKHDFALITEVNEEFLNKLEKNVGFREDSRIKFVGTVYEPELLKKIRENAFAYLHGHEVGGTNPSLLEALSSTRLNLLLDVGFNREVAEDAAMYWTKDAGNLANVIRCAEKRTEVELKAMDQTSTNRIKDSYSWDYIVNEYETLFLTGKNKGA